METKYKALIGVIVVVVVASMVGSVLTTEAYSAQSSGQGNLTPRERLAQALALLQQKAQERNAIVKWFLNGAEAVTVQGTVVADYNNILIVGTGTGRLNVLLPPVWNINSQVANLTTVYANYVSTGDTVTIKALQRAVTNEKNVTVTVIVAYEITDTTSGNHLYAVLPFNIKG
jgi:hypothetical protein